MTGLAIERNKGLLVPDTQKLLRTLKADIEDANRVRKGGKRLSADHYYEHVTGSGRSKAVLCTLGIPARKRTFDWET